MGDDRVRHCIPSSPLDIPLKAAGRPAVRHVLSSLRPLPFTLPLWFALPFTFLFLRYRHALSGLLEDDAQRRCLRVAPAAMPVCRSPQNWRCGAAALRCWRFAPAAGQADVRRRAALRATLRSLAIAPRISLLPYTVLPPFAALRRLRFIFRRRFHLTAATASARACLCNTWFMLLLFCQRCTRGACLYLAALAVPFRFLYL